MAMCVEDRISSFPDPILCHILSFLPIKEAVRTSIISTKWRYLFASISTIKFDAYSMSGLTDRNTDSFKNFVDRLLKSPDQVSLDCFRISHEICSWNDGDHDFDISGWICAALCRGVKEIDLQISYLEDILPAVLFTCDSLVTLKLDAVGHKFKFPSDVCLGNLKTLHFRDSNFGDSILRFISNCHVLEDLAFIECDFYNTSVINIQTPSLKRFILDFDLGEFGDLKYVVVINAPNLVYFQYTDVVAQGYTLSTMKSLEKAHINICGCDAIDSQTIATHLIQRICNVRSLRLTINEIFRTSRLPIFHNLIEFEFLGRGFNGREIWLVEFLHRMPNLKILTLDFPVVAGTQWKALEVPSCLSFHLKEIEISCFNTHMIEMVSYFLDNAMILEKLIINMDALTVTQKKKARNQLLQLVKSSKKCLKLVVLL
ncbi:hypothetical protein ES332_D02G068800v1 [Gossypium tomentosum]|uniref:F-box domain-containing protein n=1 Tax=Gossypium tomentosum TaxID=34277 RepID=A0A5D2LU07_GOSTO|nr:hypothetical protein ES332_D02G068800v1 [Gossypium tomentosum]